MHNQLSQDLERLKWPNYAKEITLASLLCWITLKELPVSTPTVQRWNVVSSPEILSSDFWGHAEIWWSEPQLTMNMGDDYTYI